VTAVTGKNDDGQCNVPVAPGSGAVLKWADVAAGGRHTCAIGTDRHLECWGSNDEGQCNTECTSFWIRVSTGDRHTCAIAADRSIKCWGANEMGQCDVPMTLDDSGTSIPITDFSDVCVPCFFHLSKILVNVSLTSFQFMRRISHVCCTE
jgi:alpha-tubulin suppressor-like RCC1 family protein